MVSVMDGKNKMFTQVVPEKYANEYRAYLANYPSSTLVLFSNETRSPIVSVILHCPEPNSDSNSESALKPECLITARPKPETETQDNITFFQGFFNQPEQPFSFTIANLNNHGNINLNIIQCSREGKFLHKINQVNSLKPRQIYTVPCDQETRKALMFTCLKRNEEGAQVNVTVAESESKQNTDEKQHGLYFDLVVIPEENEPLKKLFAEGTHWESVSFVFDKRPPLPQHQNHVPFMANESMFQNQSYQRRGLNTVQGIRTTTSPSFASISRSRMQEMPVSRSSFGSSANVDSSSRSFHDDPPIYRSMNRSIGGFATLSLQENAPKAMANEFPKGSTFDTESEDESFSGSLFGDDNDGLVSSYSNQSNFGVRVLLSTELPGESKEFKARSAHTKSSAKVSIKPNVVQQSVAGKLSYTGKEVDEKWCTSNVQYAFEVRSEPARLCLSYWSDLKLGQEPNWTQALNEAIDKYHGQSQTELLKDAAGNLKRFVAEFCVLSQDETLKPDTILAKCGHQCVHSSSLAELGPQHQLKNCPVCRQPIRALIPASMLD